MLKKIKELYLNGEMEGFLESMKSLQDDGSVDFQVLKLLASAIKDKTKRGNITRNIKKLDISKLDSENLSI